ncbi:MAG: hypothetical protein JSW46_04205 [Gemmatimonadota bacterium]|nr:MAG: hypothetical protein JSW46_04205 [Gemmatimonadota bacterium]
MSIYRSLSGLFALAVFIVAAATPVKGQDLDFKMFPHWALGYVVNAPTQLVGFSGLTFGPHLADWGGYVDVKLTLDSPEGESSFIPSLTPDEARAFGDIRQKDKSIWTTVNVAAVRVVSAGIAVYAGAGYSHEDTYVRYYDDSWERGEFGWYWLKDDAASGDRINLMGGVWIRPMPSVIVQFGGESAPAGVTVGAAFVLPFGR